MADTVDIPDLERIVFFPGQQLLASDLAAVQTTVTDLRWLHNRSLHTWGIGTGFAVTGDRGATAVTVGPGYGIDCLGREIILTEPRAKTVPAVAGAIGGGEAIYYLAVAYQEDADQTVVERRPGVCLPGGTVRLSEEPLLDWRRPDQLSVGLELILAQAWIQNCQLSRALSLSARRYARPSEHPYIAAGQTVAGQTAWAPWLVGNQMAGVRVQVDTSQARFRTTPRYMAHVAGDRYLANAPGGGSLLAVGVPTVAGAAPDGFTLQVLLPAMPPATPPVNPPALQDAHQAPDIVGSLGWHVIWMGVEG
jgi:hypothetical protein